MAKCLVIIPTYNEKENIRDIIQTVLGLDHPFEILIVDDGSPDGTGTIVKELQAQHSQIHLVERKGKLGLGTAYITGFKYALEHGYDLIFEMDADFSHNPNDLIKLKDACVNGADVAVGSRYSTGVNVVNWPMNRVLLSYFASAYVRFVTRMNIMDATAGFMCYKAEVLRKINLDQIKFVGYAFQIEMKFKAWKYGYNLQEVSIIFTDRTKGQSKMSGSIIKEAFFGVLMMKIGSWFRSYK